MQGAKESGEFDGADGEAGPQGPQGPQGVQGIQGEKGEKGEIPFDHLVDNYSDAIKNNAIGEIIALTDSANAPLDGLTVYGKTTQAAEPTPEAPEELKSVGADGDIKVNILGTFYTGSDVAEYEPYNEAQVMTIPTPIALNGIPVATKVAPPFTTTERSFIDSNGKPFIADYIDFERSVKVQKIWKQILNGSEQWDSRTSYYNTTSNCFILLSGELEKNKKTGIDNIICSHFKNAQISNGIWGNSNTEQGICGYGSSGKFDAFIRINNDTIGSTSDDVNANVALFKEWLSKNPITVAYELEEPIETPLTEAELVAYQEYYTNYPNTTIYSDDVAFLNIKYKADTKHYIDNKFNSLEKTILSLGGNV